MAIPMVSPHLFGMLKYECYKNLNILLAPLDEMWNVILKERYFIISKFTSYKLDNRSSIAGRAEIFFLLLYSD